MQNNISIFDIAAIIFTSYEAAASALANFKFRQVNRCHATVHLIILMSSLEYNS